MRYEFERDGTVVASVLWEGPAPGHGRGGGPLHPRHGRPVPLLRGRLPGRWVRPRRGAGAPTCCRCVAATGPPGSSSARAATWRTACRPRSGGSRPDPSTSGREEVAGMSTVKGADAVLKALEQEGVEVDLRHPRRREHADLRPAGGPLADPPRALPSRAGRGPRRRGLRLGHRQGRRVHGHQRPRRHEPRHAARRREDGLGADRRASPARSRRRSSATTRSRKPTSPASRCRSPSTTSW